MRVLSATFILSALLVLSTTSFNLQGQTPTRLQSGDWSILCSKVCKATQLLLSEDKTLKYSATLSLTDDKTLLQMKLVFPLGIYLPANTALMVNDIEKSIPVTTCVPSGCNALLIMNSELQKEMLDAPVFKIRFFSSNSRENEVIYSLKGFDEALDLVNQIN
jgi:invasion protein IalB